MEAVAVGAPLTSLRLSCRGTSGPHSLRYAQPPLSLQDKDLLQLESRWPAQSKSRHSLSKVKQLQVFKRTRPPASRTRTFSNWRVGGRHRARAGIRSRKPKLSSCRSLSEQGLQPPGQGPSPTGESVAGTEQEHSLSSGRVLSTVERAHRISGWLAVTDVPGFAPALIFLRNPISSAVQTLRKSRMRL